MGGTDCECQVQSGRSLALIGCSLNIQDGWLYVKEENERTWVKRWSCDVNECL